MKFDRLRKTIEDIERADVVSCFELGSMLAIAGAHIIPHVCVEGNIKRPRDFLTEERPAWIGEPNNLERMQSAALNAGALIGLCLAGTSYYCLAKKIHPAILAIPVVTNVISGAYEFYRSRRKHKQ
jgi:hypothetical protein